LDHKQKQTLPGSPDQIRPDLQACLLKGKVKIAGRELLKGVGTMQMMIVASFGILQTIVGYFGMLQMMGGNFGMLQMMIAAYFGGVLLQMMMMMVGYYGSCVFLQMAVPVH